MPLVVRFVEPHQERYPSTTSKLSRPTVDQDRPKDGIQPHDQELPEEYKKVDTLLSVTSSLPILESVSTNKLQALTVHRLTSLIRQLGSMAQHAENIMGTIAEGLTTCYVRTMHLESRAKKLAEEILPSLDPELEAMEGFEIPHPDFQFKSKHDLDQFILTKLKPPLPLASRIQSAHSPALQLLSPLWSNGRNAKHLYSNPGFFFEQWMTSIKKGALRRKSTTQLLSPTSPNHSKSNGTPSGRISRQDSSGKISPVGGSKKLKRSATTSRSFRGKARPVSFHSSNLSLQDAGLTSSSKSKRMQRTYSVRMPPGYSRSTRKSVKVPKAKHLGDPLSKSIAANFGHPAIEVSVPLNDSASHEPDKDSIKSDNKFQRGGLLRRSFSLRRSRSRSRSPAPPTPVVATPPDSVLNGAHMHTMEEGQKRSTSNLAVLSQRHLQHLELGTSDFDTSLSIDSTSKVTSTFKSSSNLSVRSVTPLLVRGPSPLNGQAQFPNSTPKLSSKPWTRSQSDAREHFNKLPRIQRSVTVSSTNQTAKNTASRVREKLKSEGRPASIALDDHQFQNGELQPPLAAKTISQTSLNNSRTASSQSNSSVRSPRPHSMLLGDLSTFETPLSHEFSRTLSVSSQTRSKPRRPAPPRPEGRKSGSDSGGRGTPVINTSPAQRVKTPDDTASNTNPTQKDQRSHTNDVESSPVQKEQISPDTNVVDASLSLQGQTSPDISASNITSSKSQATSNVTVKDTSPIQRDPPPPPQRHGSLSVSQNPKTAGGAMTGSGPATPGTAHTAQTHSSIVAERKESVAVALSDVLNNMSRRSLSGHPLSPGSPPFVNGDLNRTLSPVSPLQNKFDLDRTLSPANMTPRNRLTNLDKTLTPYDKSPHFGMSPINNRTPHAHLAHADTFTVSPSAKMMSFKRKQRQGSLYISPQKLSGITSPEGKKSMEFSQRADQILKAGGVDVGTIENSRGGLLAAIRTGIELKKVEQEAADTREEVAWDVAAILERYEVLHSDSEDDSDYGDEWVDEFDS